MTDALSSLHIIASRELGGAERFYMRLVQALHDAGQAVTAMNRASSRVAAELGAAVPQDHAPMAGRWDLYSRWKIGKTVRSLRPDIVQTYMTRATVLTQLDPRRGPVHIARLGGYYKIDRFRHAHAWIGNTRGICDYLVRGGLPAARVHYIGNFVDVPSPTGADRLSALRDRLGIPARAWVLFALGRFVRKKGFDVLLDACAKLPPELGDRPLHLVIVGDGPLRDELQRRAGALGLAGRVHWPGWETDPAPYYDLADVFICPSRHEPLGNVILEGWAHRRPVVSTATVGATELMADGANGCLVSGEDPAALAAAIRRLLLDEPLRKGLAEAGRAEVEAHYTRPAIVAAYTQLYRELLSSSLL